MTQNGILSRIVEHKRIQIQSQRSRAVAESWESRARDHLKPLSFADAIAAHRGMAVIAEIKKASPSAGVICKDFNPPSIAQSYFRNGACCLSVLTDEEFFQGSIEYLRAVRQTVPLPILRKDFVLDPIQIYEAKLAGASAVLLIAECLEPGELRDLASVCWEFQLDPLVEFYKEENLESALDSGAKLIGVNNRNLDTFETDVMHTARLRSRIPAERIVVSESGVKTRDDLRRLADEGVDAVLVGETLMRAEDPGRQLAHLLGRVD